MLLFTKISKQIVQKYHIQRNLANQSKIRDYLDLTSSLYTNKHFNLSNPTKYSYQNEYRIRQVPLYVVYMS